MTRIRIAGGTLALLTFAGLLGACRADDLCGSERCGGKPPKPEAVPPKPVAAAPAGAPAAHEPDKSASPADQAAAVAVHNYKRLSPILARGAVPEGDAAFAALAAAGIKTILTVDGAVPDVDAAKRHGIRYVHIPIGYDGIPSATALELAKTFEQLAPSGPIFVHCHHGKHRGPAGCEIAHIVLDGATNDEAIADMKVAGTDPKYKGLYESIRTFRKPTPEDLAPVKADMPEVAPAGTRGVAMAAIDSTWDRLKVVRTATWSSPPDHADVDPSHEAVILAEGLREFGRRPEIASESEAFRKLLLDTENAAWDLSKALEKGAVDAIKAEAAFTVAQKNCASCHTQFRDNTHR
jgi:protein tyrosine phosphatase (PTP) superfamily phosphohydrolase (DUF442 family)